MSDAYKRVTWRSHRFDKRTVAAIKALEDALGRRVTIYQGSYTSAVAVSGSTHEGGGALDFWVPGISADSVTRKARQVGWACWWRKPEQGPWGDHQHAGLLDHLTASADLKLQMGNYRHGGDGLWPLEAGDDPQPYRPDPQPIFSYVQWRRQRRLRDRLRHLARDIAALKDRRKKIAAQLRRVSTS